MDQSAFILTQPQALDLHKRLGVDLTMQLSVT